MRRLRNGDTVVDTESQVHEVLCVVPGDTCEWVTVNERSELGFMSQYPIDELTLVAAAKE